MIFRIIFDIFFFFCMAFLPWWAAIALGLLGLIILPSFYEILLAGILIDSLYTPSSEHPLAVECIVSVIAIIAFIVIELMKRRLRCYTNGTLQV